MKSLLMRDICSMRKGQTINEKDIYSLRTNDKDKSLYVVSSSTDGDGIMGSIDIQYKDRYSIIGKSGDLSWVTNGYAGKVTLRNYNFLPTEKCGIASLKSNYKKRVNPKWLEIYLNSVTSNYVIAKEGNGKLEITQMKNIPVNIPNIEVQNEIVSLYEDRIEILEKLDCFRGKIKKQIIQKVYFKTKKFKLKDLFYITSGVRITSDFIYYNPGDLPCVSAQTNNEFWKVDEKSVNNIIKNNRSVIIDEPCISWVCVGDAGSMFYRDFKFYLTDNAGVLIPKNPKQINLEWFVIQYEEFIKLKRNASSQGQSTLFTEHMSNIEIDMPVDENDEINIGIQNNIFTEYRYLLDRLNIIECILLKYKYIKERA